MPDKQKVHRALSVTSPLNRGRDIKVLQGKINDQYRHFNIDRRITQDGEFGPNTLRAAQQIALLMGVVGKARRKSKRGRISRATQKLIRGREKSRLERAATIRRKHYRAKLRHRYDVSGGKLALSKAKQQIGVTENPPGSNWGGMVTKFITFTGYNFPVYWCGCFACWCVVNAGADIPARIRLGYTGYITADAQAGVNGLTAVPFDQARAGDIVVYTFDHIGLVDHVSGETLYAVEGNTSSDDGGSQSNGGGVFARTRSKSDVVTIARPDYS